MSGAMFGTPIVMSAALRDGEVVAAFDGSCHTDSPLLVVGTRPLTDVEMAGAEARHIVRSGMADVLEWCGETVGRAPTRSGRGAELIARLREATS